jgi:uncharacterized SAM-binding protein YcdF (DUF218 family)
MSGVWACQTEYYLPSVQYDACSDTLWPRPMSWFATNLISAFLLPPLCFLLPGGVGILLWHRRPKAARLLVIASFVSLWAASTPYVAEGALRLLEGKPVALDPVAQPADAIVVLGGGTYFHAPEYGTDTVSEPALVRLRYAAKLYRETGKPVLATGGSPLGNALPEAQQMKTVLENEFRVPVKWTEDASDNTLENARFSFRILQRAGIRRIYLVTHAWHMPRAAMAFRAAGFDVVPAPTAFTTRYRTDLLSFLPNAGALNDSRIFMHEVIGLLWYRLKS